MPVISTNTAANSALVNLNRNSAMQENYLNQLSSGSRINKSSDDAAGLAVSVQLQSDITTLEQSARNAQQGEALLQIADGALSRQADILQRMKSLATQYNSGTVDDEAREFINAEYEELIKEIDLITTSTEYNGNNLIDGGFNQDFIVGIQVEDKISVDLTDIDTSATGLGLSNTLSLSTLDVFEATIVRTDGTDPTADTLISDLDATSELRDGAIQFTFDANADGDFVDTNEYDLTYTVATGDTIQDVVDGINALVDANGDQVFRAVFERGQLKVELYNGAAVDIDNDGESDGALSVVGAGNNAGLTAANVFSPNQVFDDLQVIDAAIRDVSEARSTIGAYTSAMQYQGENIATQIENLTAAKSTIVDADIAEAQTNFTNAQVLTEAATAALAQANALKTSLLAILR